MTIGQNGRSTSVARATRQGGAPATVERYAERGSAAPIRQNGDAVPLRVNGERRAHAAPTYRYHGWQRHLKRGIDVTATVIALPIVVPVMLVLGIAVFISSPGNPIFLQERVGYRNERFRCIKFRSMHRNAEDRLHADPELYAYYIEHDFKLPLRVDPRVFPLGRLLRRASLDELPQLFNVLAGHMSLVGPRPIVPAELSCYGEYAPAYTAVRPGLTGAWQTAGRNNIKYPERAELDAEYLATWRLSSDIKILARTLPSLFRHRPM